MSTSHLLSGSSSTVMYVCVHTMPIISCGIDVMYSGLSIVRSCSSIGSLNEVAKIRSSFCGWESSLEVAGLTIVGMAGACPYVAVKYP